MSKALYIESIMEERDSFFVEYQPPIASGLFATLNVNGGIKMYRQ